jgi:ribosomal protein S18 acetylase RimI-like enzyme
MVTIRPVTSDDEESVFRLAAQLSPKFGVKRDAFSRSFFQLAQSRDVFLHVADDQGNVVAYLLGWIGLAFYSNGPVGWVQEVVVEPAHRRNGIGKLLMEEFESWTAERGGTLVSLATSGAPEFYLALGYRESAKYYKKPLGTT